MSAYWQVERSADGTVLLTVGETDRETHGTVQLTLGNVLRLIHDLMTAVICVETNAALFTNDCGNAQL